MSEQEKSKEGKADASAKEEQAQNPSGIAGRSLKSDMPPTPCNNGGKKTHKRPLHEWIKYFVEIFGILGGLVGLVVLILQYCETAKTTKVLSGQLQEMQATRILDERAWVMIVDVSKKPMEQNSEDLVVLPEFTNTGKTPALKCGISVSWTTNFNEIPPANIIPTSNVFPFNGSTPNGMIAPGGAAHIYSQPIPKAIVEQIRNERLLVYVDGAVWYYDIFQQFHWMRYCFKITPDIQFSPIPELNTCDDAQTNQTN
jgi:hypothetical protein